MDVAAPGCLLRILSGRPLRVHFSLVNPPETEQPVRVPAVLGPVGAFVELQVRDADARLVYETERPKLKLKLDPRRPSSYLALQPGYSFGAVLELDPDELWLEPGDYLVRSSYDSHEYSGPEGEEPLHIACSAEEGVSLE